MASGAKVLRNGTIRREEALGMPRRLALLQTPLPLARGLRRVLGAVMQIAVLSVFYAGEALALRSTVAFELIGDEHPWHGGQALEELAEELLRGLFVPPALHQDVEPIPVLIHRPP
jgi:hypothetical protein